VQTDVVVQNPSVQLLLQTPSAIAKNLPYSGIANIQAPDIVFGSRLSVLHVFMTEGSICRA